MVRNAVCLGISTSIDDTKDGPSPEETDDPDDLEALQVRSVDPTRGNHALHCHSQPVDRYTTHRRRRNNPYDLDQFVWVVLR